MAKGKSGSGLSVGDPVSFNYRSAKDVKGTIVAVRHKGDTQATTLYAVQPEKQFVHPGEHVPVHRTGAHLRKRSAGKTPKS